MKRTFAIIWHLVIFTIAAYFLGIVTTKVSGNLSGVDRDDGWWPIVRVATISMAYAGFAIASAAVAASALFAGKIGKLRRALAAGLVVCLIAGWIYGALLWVNYPLRMYETTILAEMFNLDGAMIALLAIVLLAVPAITGTGVFGQVEKLVTRKNRPPQADTGRPDPDRAGVN